MLVLGRFCLTLLVAATMLPATTLGQTRKTPAPDHPARFEAEIQAFEGRDQSSPPPPRSVLFIGSSSIKNWTTLADDFPGIPVLNRGFGGSTMADVFYYMHRIALHYRPRLVVLYAGDNDVAMGRTPDRILTDYRAVVWRLRSSDPAMRIAYVAIKPSPSRRMFLRRVRETNRLIREEIARDSMQRYVDVFTPMLGPDAQPRPELFLADSLHMTPTGYQLWRALLKPVVIQGPPAGRNRALSLPDTLKLDRVASGELRIHDAGWALITEQLQWEKLWRDYGQEGYRDEGLIVPKAPLVDFDSSQVLAVSFGPKSDCSSRVIIVERVVEYRRERVATITPDHWAQGGPCQMIVEPIDLVVIPRSTKPLRLKLVTRLKEGHWKEAHWKVPPPATWWVPLSVQAARDSGTTAVTRRAYELSRRVLPRDTTLPVDDYRALVAEAFATRDFYIKRKLRHNPRAMRDRDIVAWLATDTGVEGAAELRLDFLRRFGLQVASDRQAPQVWLATLMQLLMDRTLKESEKNARDIAMALTDNPAVMSDTVLAMRLTFGVQHYPDVLTLACRRYLERYPRAFVTLRDSSGEPLSRLLPNCDRPVKSP